MCSMQPSAILLSGGAVSQGPQQQGWSWEAGVSDSGGRAP